MFSYLKNLYRILLELITPNAWILEGNERSTNKPLKILYIGSKRDKYYMTSTIFNNTCNEAYLGRKSFLKLCYILHKNKYRCSLIIIEGTFIDRYLYRSIKDFFIPFWVDSITDLPLTITKSSAKYDMRKIRKNNLEYIVTSDTEMLHDFYYNMHRAMIRARYQIGAYEETYDDIIEKMEKACWDLLLIKKKNVFLSGVIIERSGRIPKLWKNGIRDINYWKDGAMAATYVFSSNYLWKKGYKKVSLGLIRSFLNDGLLQYKRKWNITLKVASKRGYILKPLIISDGVKAFFLNNPFIYIEKNKLYGAVFINEDEDYYEENYREFQKKYHIKGLSELNVFIIRENGTMQIK